MLKLHLLCATISSKKLYLKLWKLKQKSVWKSVTSEAFFKATDKEVCKRLVELEMRSGDNLSQDSLSWKAESNGIYFVKSFCKNSTADTDGVWKLVWSSLAPSNVEVFVWKLVLGRIPTKTELQKRESMSQQNSSCPLCSKDPETASHLFCHCPVTWLVRNRWCRLWGVHMVFSADVRNLLL
ncbi:hypothetical protein V6N11_015896 [Hibiscus sabdariffa]|uniref:Reverse transcriptase zinc-binding domain-containing protein n=1 Tax=Hibiscus sabdariffa TaxID=183260 RepID=A0ABR2TTJ7_9ROSI